MAESMKEILNPGGHDLTPEQQEVLNVFEEVDQEMQSLDSLSQRLSGLVLERTKSTKH